MPALLGVELPLCCLVVFVYNMQMFVFFPDAAKVGVKDIKVGNPGVNRRCWHDSSSIRSSPHATAREGLDCCSGDRGGVPLSLSLPLRTLHNSSDVCDLC